MPRSSRSFLFPDVNVWLALTVDSHIHHFIAHRWLSSLDLDAYVCFCRATQISFLRLLTTEAVMGKDKTLSQAEAWKTYDRWLENDRVSFVAEPPEVEAHFRSLSNQNRPAPKDWADAYLAAFAYAADLTLVSFDQTFRSKLKNVQLLSI
jgi:uncharacterized protein